MALSEVVAFARELLPADAVLTDASLRRTYASDGLLQYAEQPGVVLLPRDEADVVALVRACVSAAVPYVARGAGTGLSAGALPEREGALIVLTRQREVRDVDLDSRCATLGPGVTNLEVSKAVAGDGLFYAPDPSSQQACTIGGNVAENSGGAHCLKYGFTTNHVLGLRVVTGNGELVELGGAAPDAPGYDLVGAFVGSEGTLGIATEVTVRLLPRPEAVVTLLAGFDTLGGAGDAVAATIASGVLPSAIEMMDAYALAAIAKAVGVVYPTGADAVLLVELDGPASEVAIEETLVTSTLEAHGSRFLRRAADEAERVALWKGRKSAFAAVGRTSPDFIVQDGVVPRSALGAVLADIEELTKGTNVKVANVFHAGDGNLHPLVLFDGAVPGAAEQAYGISGAIIDLCLAHGGSITGEHGVGFDKKRYLGRMFDEDDLSSMTRLRCAFDPHALANPNKVFPTPRLCGEAPRHRHAADGDGASVGALF